MKHLFIIFCLITLNFTVAQARPPRSLEVRISILEEKVRWLSEKVDLESGNHEQKRLFVCTMQTPYQTIVKTSTSCLQAKASLVNRCNNENLDYYCNSKTIECERNGRPFHCD